MIKPKEPVMQRKSCVLKSETIMSCHHKDYRPSAHSFLSSSWQMLTSLEKFLLTVRA